MIQPHLPVRLPCYDFTPVADLTVADCLLAVSLSSLGKTNFHGVTGGVYKARERIHRDLTQHLTTRADDSHAAPITDPAELKRSISGPRDRDVKGW